MFKSSGLLTYYTYTVQLDVDPEIARYCRSFIPKYVSYNLPMYPPHISVVRKALPLHIEDWNVLAKKNWGKHNGETIDFCYDNELFTSEKYIWINCFSKRLDRVRTELGLENKTWGFVLPKGYKHVFHVTIGNFK